MTKLLVFGGILLLVAVPQAQGATINLWWGTGCDPWYQTVLAFPCDTNIGHATMSLDFELLNSMEVAGFEAYLVGRPELDVPDWWQLGDGGCRSGALSASAGFQGCVAEEDPWQGTAGQAALAYGPREENGRPLNGWGLNVSFTLDAPVTLQEGIPYDVCHISFDYSRTTGPGSCSGCDGRFNWQLMSITLHGPDGDRLLDVPGNTCIYWQGYMPSFCEIPVPVRNSTWGHIKSLYR
jgi:hypothetical protein